MEPVALNPATLRGLAHPLRVRLLNLLRERGPSTASKLADQLGQSSGATSYHLRQLAAHGFVADEPGRGNARERWWRASHAKTTLNAETGRADPAAAEGYLRAVLTADFQRVESFLSELPTVPREWQDAVDFSSVPRRLTPARAAEMRDRIAAVIADFPDEDLPGAERVRVQTQVFPTSLGSET